MGGGEVGVFSAIFLWVQLIPLSVFLHHVFSVLPSFLAFNFQQNPKENCRNGGDEVEITIAKEHKELNTCVTNKLC